MDPSRRTFLKHTTTALAGCTAGALANAANPADPDAASAAPIIDIHQHTNYSGRTDAQLLHHQKAMGITRTILLPAGIPIELASTHSGRSNGLAARIWGNGAAYRLVRAFPETYSYFANEVPDVPGAVAEIEKHLELGALGIGEQKFNIDVDSKPMHEIFALAQAHRVPVLIHFQHGMYNHGLDRFHKILEKYPDVSFIGHAQTWWGNIDKAHQQEVLYPKTPVTPGGISDRLLADYPNMFGDLSAGSGQNSLTRDEEHAAAFIERHQDKLFYGSDCNDTAGLGDTCSGAGTLEIIQQLASSPDVVRKVLHDNAKKVIFRSKI
ncbi:MAG: putative TIM-barrel fold metal-dependent hydrolase [Verrucomicrobiales bacterium]|jgi:predicted TIM-barrel fold metal-dependent hydrolase